jgi:hypothetical protein
MLSHSSLLQVSDVEIENGIDRAARRLRTAQHGGHFESETTALHCAFERAKSLLEGVVVALQDGGRVQVYQGQPILYIEHHTDSHRLPRLRPSHMASTVDPGAEKACCKTLRAVR